MRVMMIHVLCLVLTLRVGFSSPVDSDYDFGSDFDSSMEFISFPDEGNDTKDVAPVINPKVERVYHVSQHFEATIDGALGQERWFTDDTTIYMGDVFVIADEGDCCQECQKYHFDTTLYGFSQKSFNQNDCACLKPVEGRRPATRAAGEVSGKCGTWNYRGDGALGDDRYFANGVEGLGLMTGVEAAAACCDECHRRYPETQLFTFYKGKNYCSCHKTAKGQITVTRQNTYAAGICDPMPAPMAPKLEDMMMGDAPAITADQNEVFHVDHDETGVVGAVGEGRSFKLDTVEYRGDVRNVTSAEESARCCGDCQKEWPDSQLYIFSKRKRMCYCYAEIKDIKPETIASSKFFSSVCHKGNDEKKKA